MHENYLNIIFYRIYAWRTPVMHASYVVATPLLHNYTWIRTTYLIQWTGNVGCVTLPAGEEQRLGLVAQFPYWQGCVLTQAPIAVARAIGTKCPLSGSGGNCYTCSDLKHGRKYLAICQWKHSQEGYLHCQRKITKTNSHDAVMDQRDWQ